MPDIKQVLNEEIRRLARKELKNSLAPLVNQLNDQKRLVAELKKEIAQLKKALPKEEITAGDTVDNGTDENIGKLRLSASGIVKIRKKLGLTQGKFADLLGVSGHTVSLWEVGKVSPRANVKSAICALRTIGKKEFKQRLAALDSKSENQ
ncbi:MAG: helix-turn-helix domain-containing protein [Lentisphaerae bacterium]|nr:helix-turn-helix domain-containing protein [Lentisphaerota bacterium]